MANLLHLTDAGVAAVTGPAGSATAVIAQLGLTATAFDFAPTLTALPGEFKRLSSVAGTASGDNLVHLEAFDNSADLWTATGLALYLSDGTLFAALSADEPILAKASLAYTLIALDVAFAADIAANISFGDLTFSSPPATTTTRGLIEIATQPETDAGNDTQRALVAGRTKQALPTWLQGRDLVLGQVDVQTPDNGSTGGLRLRGNATSGKAYLQVTNHDTTEEWGFVEVDADGTLNWLGAGGIRAGGSTAWKGNGFDGPFSVDGNLTVKNGFDFFIEAQMPGAPVSLIYNDSGTFGFKSNEYERIYIDAGGAIHVKGPRQYGNAQQVGGSASLRAFAATPGGYALGTFDFQDYWPLQCVRDIGGTPSMVGGIHSTDTATTFATSSDHRLKEDLQPVETPLNRLLAIKPRNFRWIGTDKRTDGFIAHELAQVVPDAVVGEHNAMREVQVTLPVPGDGSLDDEGNPIEAFGPPEMRTELVPDYQSVDQSKVVPLLVAALQELATQYATSTAAHEQRIAALEQQLASPSGEPNNG